MEDYLNYGFSKKYLVVGGADEFFATDNPTVAIRLWLLTQERFPQNVAIKCKWRKDAIELLDQVSDVLLESYCGRYKVPYKVEFLKDSVRNQLKCKCKYFLDGIGDQIEPFSFG